MHDIKISEEFASDVLNGNKLFEIRENDRGYQMGDRVRFMVVSTDLSAHYIDHPLNQKTYEITYVLSGWGLENGHVAFGIREIAACHAAVQPPRGGRYARAVSGWCGRVNHKAKRRRRDAQKH